MNIASLPPGAAFLDEIAIRWRAAHGADPLARGLILLPTRRAARALAEAFLRAANGASQLLPRLTAFGALDEAPLALTGVLDLPPAVGRAQRLAELSRMILALPREAGGVETADRAWLLALELAALMDEAERMELDLPDALAKAADAEHAAHWDVTLRFLAIVTRAWPDWLAAGGLDNPERRQARLLATQARAWEDTPPDFPVWIAGTNAAIPSVARLMKVVAGLRHGQVILPGLDHELDDDTWADLAAGHPQAGLADLLARLGATRADVDALAPPSPRACLLARALLPAARLDDWRRTPPEGDSGLYRLDAADPQEEAVAIALILRNALETPGARAALVTPDRTLARRVAAELLHWHVVADDSAGEPLGETPPAVFLRLLADAVAADLAPVKLLALLKHPLAAAGLPPAICRAMARTLEVAVLRGPRPPPGLGGLREAIARHRDAAALEDFLGRIETALSPALRAMSAVVAAPRDVLAALVEAGEALAATDEVPGPARLWALEEGEALAAALAEALEVLDRLPDQRPATLPGLLTALLEGTSVRSRRALRGRQDRAEHPRVFIWGLLEARLQRVDVMVLGSLAEGVWPPATDPGPWLSRPMRRNAGLPSPEERIGQAAHDFVMAACAADVTVLSCPRRQEGAPTVPARWLTRIDALLGGYDRTLRRHPAARWARALDLPAGGPRPVPPPTPRPPVALRPRRLRVTEVQTWLEDPYAIYARHVLRLAPLKPLEEETDAADYGTLVHRGLQVFLAAHGATLPPDAAAELRAAMDRALVEARLRPALAEWWAPRLARIADWVAEEEARRRANAVPVQVLAEVSGTWIIPGTGADPFALRGRADRIDVRADGSLVLFDYKTGQPPSQAQVDAGFAPQLPLEAAMAAAGAFAGVAGIAAELVYWHLPGGHVPGEAQTLYKGDAARVAESASEAAVRLAALVAAYDDPARAYLAQPHPGRPPRFPDYAQLARVAEWSTAGADE